MITSILSKSKPINFIIVFFITLLAFLIANIKLIIEPITVRVVLYQLLLFFVICASVLILDFIVSKNKLTQNNNYEILLIALFLLTMPDVLSNNNIIFSNVFILLGLRRLISLRSQKEVNKKLFDTAFWFAIAALFYFWSILFFILILIALALYTDNKIKHWIIPFTAVITVFLLGISVSVVAYNNFFGVFKSLPEVSFDFSNYNTIQYLIALTVLTSFGTWSSLYYIKEVRNKKKIFRPSYKIILFAVLIAMIISLLAPYKNGGEFLFMFSPLVIVMANYIETIEEKWFKEVFLGVIVILPFVLLML